jgi:hypothetical protein
MDSRGALDTELESGIRAEDTEGVFDAETRGNEDVDFDVLSGEGRTHELESLILASYRERGKIVCNVSRAFAQTTHSPVATFLALQHNF